MWYRNSRSALVRWKKIEDATDVQFTHEEHYQVAEDARKRELFATFFITHFQGRGKQNEKEMVKKVSHSTYAGNCTYEYCRLRR